MKIISSVALAGALLLGVPPALAAPADTADAVEVHEGDVFVIVGSTLRTPDAGTDPAAPLFTDSGIAMDLTWGEWSAATATSRASVTGGAGKHPRTDVRLSLAGLVPGGLYSVFWGTLGPDSEQPLCPNVERTLPLDAVGGGGGGPAPNAFVADAAGAAAFHGRTDGNLFAASQVFFSVVYHFFPETSYPFPNRGELLSQGENCRSSFGADAMRQLLVLQQW
ncbi:MAG TPA: hypothetical protein VJ653_07585 [Acidimicrobiales bacterium]|nr:hypothetical protein [Acidimicrobiales bacterium]